MLKQVEIANHLDLSQQVVSDLIRREVFPRPHRGPECTLDFYRVAYIRHLREIAAGRASEDDTLDLVAERARLATEQADATDVLLSQRRPTRSDRRKDVSSPAFGRDVFAYAIAERGARGPLEVEREGIGLYPGENSRHRYRFGIPLRSRKGTLMTIRGGGNPRNYVAWMPW